MLRLRVELVAAGDGANFDAAIVGGVSGDHFVESRADSVLFLADRLGDLIDRGGFVRGVNDRLKCAFQFNGIHSH